MSPWRAERGRLSQGFYRRSFPYKNFVPEVYIRNVWRRRGDAIGTCLMLPSFMAHRTLQRRFRFEWRMHSPRIKREAGELGRGGGGRKIRAEEYVDG